MSDQNQNEMERGCDFICGTAHMLIFVCKSFIICKTYARAITHLNVYIVNADQLTHIHTNMVTFYLNHDNSYYLLML